MRRAGELRSAEEEMELDRERAALEADEKALALARDAALRALGGGAP
jgi:hypothetical protein